MAPTNLVSALLGLPLFPLFSRLPKELRDAIWEYSISEPRIVSLRRRRLAQGPNDEQQEEIAAGDMNRGFWGFKCDLSPPAILFVNREAHNAALRFYSKAFPCIRSNHTSVPEAYFDFERDTLYLNGDWTLQMHYRPDELEQAEREKVKHLAALYVKTNDESFADELAGRECREENEAWVAQSLAYFPNVKTLTVVLEHFKSSKYEEGLTGEGQVALAYEDRMARPIDVNASLEVFENKNDVVGRAPIPDHPRSFSLDWRLLEERRLEAFRGDFVPPEDWAMPKIEQRVMMSAGLKGVVEKVCTELSW